jgi:hypothetical protein
MFGFQVGAYQILERKYLVQQEQFLLLEFLTAFVSPQSTALTPLMLAL